EGSPFFNALRKGRATDGPSGPAERKCQRPWLERLAIDAGDAFQQLHLDGAEPLQRRGKPYFEDAVGGVVLGGEIDRRRVGLAAFSRLRLKVGGADAPFD